MTCMSWISLCWKSFKCTLISIQSNYRDLQCRLLMLCIVGWKRVCIHNIVYNVFNIDFLVYDVARIIYHKQSSGINSE